MTELTRRLFERGLPREPPPLELLRARLDMKPLLVVQILIESIGPGHIRQS